MGVSTTTNRVEFVGDGVTTSFSFPYYTFYTTDIRAWLYTTATAVGVQLTLGTDFTITGTPNLQGIYPSGVTLTLLTSANLPAGVIPTGTNLEIYRQPATTQQEFQLIQNGTINAYALVQAFDYVTLLIQRLHDRVDKAARVPDSVPMAFSGLLPANIELNPNAILAVNPTGTGYAFGPSTTSLPVGGSSLLGLPTSGAYGTHLPGDPSTAGPVTGIDQGQTVNNAFNEVELTFEKLAPSPPPNLSAISLGISGSYASFQSTTGTAVPVTINTGSPVVMALTAFNSGSSGILTGVVDTVNEGTLTISAGGTGTNLWLQITSNVDPYAGVFGKAGFYYALLAQINAVSLAVGSHVASITHSVTGTSTLHFDVDNSGTPTIGTTSAVGSGTTGYISGVPALLTGGVITPTFTVSNAVLSHYNATRIGAATLFGVTVNAALPGTPPASGAAVVVSPAVTVIAGQYSETPTVALKGYAANGNLATTNITPSIRVDSMSSEANRYLSGSGQYPTIGSGGTQFGGSWVAATSLASNVELQMLAGYYQYPPAVNYTGNLPTAGPNYTSLSPDSYANMRWVTFEWGSISSASSVAINITGGVNLGSSVLISGFRFYVLVNGATPTAGWVDGNSAYLGVGNPTNNGDAALDVANSTVTLRKITFGTSVKTGNVWVRVGIPQGSSIKIQGVA